MIELRCPRLLLALLPVVLLSLPVGTVAAEGLVPHTAEYKVKISFLGGTMETDVSATADGYAAHSVIKPKGFANVLMNGSIEEYSEFVSSGDGVRPRHYESVDTLSSDHKRMNFDFDYAAREVAGHINDAEYRFEFDGPVHDRVSIQYELMLNLLHRDAGTEYALLDGDELKHLTVTNIGKRKVRVPFGEFEAIGIQHRAAESSRVNTLWCVEELGYLPVVIEQHRKGKLRVRAELRNYMPKTATQAAAADE